MTGYSVPGCDDPAGTPTRAGPVNVLHVLGSLDRGGAETVALQLCRSIPPDVVTQTFVCLAGRPGELAPDVEQAGALVIPMKLSTPGFPLSFLRLLRRRRPDAVVSHVSLASTPVLALARAAGVKQRIARFHSEGDGRGGGPRTLYRWAMRGLLPQAATHALGVTHASLEFGVGDRRTGLRRGLVSEVVPNGVDTDDFQFRGTYPRTETEMTVVHIGRAAPEKNRRALPSLQRALAELTPNVFLLYGSHETSDLGEHDSAVVRAMGPTNNVRGALETADVLVLPSWREGLPGVVLEALASGVPVVASDLPGLRELSSSVPGITLISLDAAPETWARALYHAGLTDEDGRRTIAAQFRRSRFTLKRNAEYWTKLWRGDT